MEQFREKEKYEKLRKSNLFGLCLSGGGYRSAIFCFGVLKKLHELGCLEKTDYLSTVSGGAWIGTAYSVAEDLDEFFKGDILKKNLNDHFLDLDKVLPWIFKSLIVNSTSDTIAQTLEENFILPFRKNSWDLLLEEKNFFSDTRPYLIIGAAYNPDSDDITQRFDFTPLYSGNKFLSFESNVKIKTPKGTLMGKLEPLRVKYAIASSGAALGFDRGKIALMGTRKFINYSPNLKSGKFKLSDGGHYENLGLEALVSRGCRNILICDAEHDSETAEGKQKFDALVKDFGEKNGAVPWAQEIKEVMNRKDKAFGVISGKDGMPNVIYIKLKKVSAFPGKLGGDFPQYETAKLKYSYKIFDALSGLGEYIVAENRKEIEKFFRQ
ncbi:MAG: patatin-like phospholipase family protein [Fusobacteriaceae bacterium]